MKPGLPWPFHGNPGDGQIHSGASMPGSQFLHHHLRIPKVRRIEALGEPA